MGSPGVCRSSSWGGSAGAGRDALTSLSLSVRLSLSLHFALPLFSRGVSLQMEQQLPGGPVWLPALDLEKWYQEVMAGFETSSSSLSPPSSPPPLPAKAHSSHKPLQVIPAPCRRGSGSGLPAAVGAGQRGDIPAGHPAAAAGRGRADPQWTARLGQATAASSCLHPCQDSTDTGAGSGEGILSPADG